MSRPIGFTGLPGAVTGRSMSKGLWRTLPSGWTLPSQWATWRLRLVLTALRAPLPELAVRPVPTTIAFSLVWPMLAPVSRPRLQVHLFAPFPAQGKERRRVRSSCRELGASLFGGLPSDCYRVQQPPIYGIGVKRVCTFTSTLTKEIRPSRQRACLKQHFG